MNPVTSLYDLHFRNYDPLIGRFMQVDPKALIDFSVSPYVYAGNNPVSMNDPLGDMKVPPPEPHQGPEFRSGFLYEYAVRNGGIIGGGGGGSGRVIASDYSAMANYIDQISNEARGIEWNYGLMSRSEFEGYYNVDLSTSEGKAKVAKAMSQQIYNSTEGFVSGIFNATGLQMPDGSIKWLSVSFNWDGASQQRSPAKVDLLRGAPDVLEGLLGWASFLDNGPYARRRSDDPSDVFNLQRDILLNSRGEADFMAPYDVYNSPTFTAGNGVRFNYTIAGPSDLTNLSKVRNFDIFDVDRRNVILNGNASQMTVRLTGRNDPRGGGAMPIFAFTIYGTEQQIKNYETRIFGK